MKYAGKKATMMPPNKGDIENAADAAKPGDAVEDTSKTIVKKTKKVKPSGLTGGLSAFINNKMGKASA